MIQDAIIESAICKAEDPLGMVDGVETSFTCVKENETTEEDPPITVKVENIGTNNEKKRSKRKRKTSKVVMKARPRCTERVLCSQCGASCLKTSLRTHMIRWHDAPKREPRGEPKTPTAQCPVCGKMISDKWNLSKHLRNVHNVPKCETRQGRWHCKLPTAQCPVCEKMISDKKNLKKHIRNVHKGTST